MRCTGTHDFRIWREEPPIKRTVSIKMLLIEKVVGGKLWIIHYSSKGVLELKVWKLFFPEYALSLPFWSLSFSFVSGSDPLNFIFLLEKKPDLKTADGVDRVSLERNDTQWPENLKSWTHSVFGWGVGRGLPYVLGPWICQIYLTLFSQTPWKLGILPMKSRGLEGLLYLSKVTKFLIHRDWIGWSPGLTYSLRDVSFSFSLYSWLTLFFFMNQSAC